eukprot:scaffold13_cov241-Pinguiococcus_pyrenoidosus.AAC.31
MIASPTTRASARRTSTSGSSSVLTHLKSAARSFCHARPHARPALEVHERLRGSAASPVPSSSLSSSSSEMDRRRRGLLFRPSMANSAVVETALRVAGDARRREREHLRRRDH